MKIAWWNCSYKTATDADIQDIHAVIEEFKKSSFDIICLGEIDDKRLALAIDNIATDYDVHHKRPDDGRHRFCRYFVLFKPELAIREPELIDVMSAGDVIKVGYHVKIKSPHGNHLNLIVSHWRSRLHDYHDIIKEDAASELRRYVGKMLESNIDTNIVLLGDYNDEPHNKSIVEKLKTTRDIGLASTKPYLLYNLSWNDLTFHNSRSIYGTHYYTGGKFDRWHVFDQIIITSSLIKHSGGLGVFNYGILFPSVVDLPSRLTNNHSKIDHMPILIEIKELQNE